MRVRACGVCRTDLHLAEGDLPPRRHGVVPGHQVVGDVIERGDGASRFAVGDRIGVAWLRSTCGRCRFCRRGDENLCLFPEFTGWDHDGGFADRSWSQRGTRTRCRLRSTTCTPRHCSVQASSASARWPRRGTRQWHARPLGFRGVGPPHPAGGAAPRRTGSTCSLGATQPGNWRSSSARPRRRATESPTPERLDAAILFAPAGEPGAGRAARPRPWRDPSMRASTCPTSRCSTMPNTSSRSAGHQRHREHPSMTGPSSCAWRRRSRCGRMSRLPVRGVDRALSDLSAGR